MRNNLYCSDDGQNDGIIGKSCGNYILWGPYYVLTGVYKF